MDRTKYEEARQFYKKQDYRKAARLFLESTDENTALDNGAAFHGAGNAFMRLKRYRDAIVVYEQALRDEGYQKRGNIESNLGNAYLQNGDFGQAVTHFEAALGESSTNDPYKCYLGLAHAYFEQQAYDEASVAYKNAALDERNPNPAAALVNLGLCMMALRRPQAAVEAYTAALGIPGYANQGRALANLGMAYYACADYAGAQRSLEEASIVHHYPLNAAAQKALADSRVKVEQGLTAPAASEESTDKPATSAAEPQPPAGEAAAEAGVPQEAPQPTEQSAADTTPAPSSAAGTAPAVADEGPEVAFSETGESAPGDQDTGQIGPLEGVDDFFALSEQEIARQGRQEQREQRGVWRWLKPLLIVALIVAILAGSVVAFFSTGFGVPSVESTVTELFTAYNTGGVINDFWVPGTSQINQKMAMVPTPSNTSIDAVDSNMLSSTVHVTVTASGTTKLKFIVNCRRVQFGWKVSSITGDY